MQKHRLTAAVALALAAGFAACDDDDETGPSNPRFTAAMTTAKEVDPNPAITSGATGTTNFTQSGGTISYTIDVITPLSTNAAAAHIHGPASTTENAGVIVPLTPVAAQTSGRLATGSFTATDITAANVSFDSLLVLMRNGNAYVNVHTTQHPAGEIRGQIEDLP